MVCMIRLEKWVSTKGAGGDFKETVTKYNLWADVSKTGGSRNLLNGRNAITDTYQFKIRFRPDFKPTGNWKIVYEGKRYTVTNIEKDLGKRFYWNFSCEGK